MKRSSKYKKDKRVNNVVYLRLTDTTHRRLIMLAGRITSGNLSAMARLLIEQGIDRMLNEHKKNPCSDVDLGDAPCKCEVEIKTNEEAEDQNT